MIIGLGKVLKVTDLSLSYVFFQYFKRQSNDLALFVLSVYNEHLVASYCKK
jgi:hypothetical protein